MKKALSLLLAIALCVGMFASCAPAETPADSTSGSGSTDTPASSDAPAEDEGGLPLTTEDVTLTWFTPIYNANIITSADDQYCWEQIQADTGVDIEFIHPPAGTQADALNVRLASGDYTDIITWAWINYSGGPGKVIDDGVILDLTPHQDLMVNYNEIIESTESAQANATLDDGRIYGFIHAVPDPIISAFNGFTIREDWLAAVDMEVPETLDDWYEVLTAFKNDDPNGNGEADELPFVSESTMAQLLNFSVAYSTRATYYPDPDNGGAIAYGPTQDKFKEFIIEMNKWYNEGLIDPEFPTNARKNIDDKASNNTVGAYYGSLGTQLDVYNTTLRQTYPDATYMGINSPTAENGATYSVQDALVKDIGNQSSTITTANEHVELSVKLLDYLYDDEGGRMYLNWGEEGVSYEMVDGEPQYTDLIMNNPDGLSKIDAIAPYAVPIFGYFSAFYVESYSSINLASPEQAAAGNIWAVHDYDMLMPTFFPTAEETDVITSKGNDINTHTAEMLIKFVIGTEPLENYDEYVAELEDMGVNEVVATYQGMYDRYLAKTE